MSEVDSLDTDTLLGGLPQSYEVYAVIGAVIIVAAIALQGAAPFIWMVGLLIVAAAGVGGWMIGNELNAESTGSKPVALLSNGPVKERTPELNPVLSEKELTKPSNPSNPSKWQVSVPHQDPYFAELRASIESLQNQHKNKQALMGGYHVVQPPVEACTAFMRTAIVNPGNHLKPSIHESRTPLGPRGPHIGSTNDLVRKHAFGSLLAPHQGGRLPSNYQTIYHLNN